MSVPSYEDLTPGIPGVAGAETANHGDMMGLGALEKHRPRSQRTVDVKSLGHCW